MFPQGSSRSRFILAFFFLATLFLFVFIAGSQAAPRDAPLPMGQSDSSLANGSWKSIKVADNGTNASLAIDAAGKPHISYYDEVNRVLKYAYHDGTRWHYKTLASDGAGWTSSLRLDSIGRPHVAYFDANLDIRYAFYDGAAWNDQGVAGNGKDPSLALDSNDRPRIAYDDRDTGLIYLKHDGSSWQPELVVEHTISNRSYWNTSLDLDASGRPHIMFDNGGHSGTVYYAHKNGSSWEVETIRENARSVLSGNLVADSLGHPHLCYYEMRGSAPYVIYKFHDGSSWQMDSRSFSAHEYARCAVAVDDGGHFYLAYSKFRSGLAQNLYMWSNRTDIDVNVEKGGGVNAVDLDASSNPHIVFDNNSNELKYTWWEETCESRLPDYFISSAEPVQVLEGVDLVRSKATAIKVVVGATCPEALNIVDVRVNYDGRSYDRFFVSETDNMYPDTHALKYDNRGHPLRFGYGETEKTVYFFDDDFAAKGSTFEVSTTVDPMNIIGEKFETNNSKSSVPKPVKVGSWNWGLNIEYFRADWDKGFLEALPDDYYKSSTELMYAVFPIARYDFKPYMNPYYVARSDYHRGGDNKVNSRELGQWLSSQLALMLMKSFGSPNNRFVVIVPPNWFKDITSDERKTLSDAKGLIFPLMPEIVIAEADASRLPNGHFPVVHEIGHSIGLYLGCEDYDVDCDKERDRVGSPADAGIWVEKKIPILPAPERPIFSYMGGHSNKSGEKERWTKAADYEQLFSKNAAAEKNIILPPPIVIAPNTIFAAGSIDKDDHVVMDDWFEMSYRPTSIIPTGPYAFEYLDSAGKKLHSFNFDVAFEAEGIPLEKEYFALTIPRISNTKKFLIKKNGVVLAEKKISAISPSAQLMSPNGGEQLNGLVNIRYWAMDEVGVKLTYSLFVSRDNGESWDPIVGGLRTTNHEWDTSSMAGGNMYRIKVIASDGYNTGEDVSDGSFSIGGSVNLPIILGGN